MGNKDLQTRLVDAGLGRVASDILRLSMPAIGMDCRRVGDEALLLGSSKLGGCPDLPSGRRWPTWQRLPMAFIAQVNLADVAIHDVEGHLPRTGLLSFFCALDGTGAGLMQAPEEQSSWSVSHLDCDLHSLVRLPFPTALPERLRFPACQASFARDLTLPDVESREIIDLGFSEPERHGYIDVLTGADQDFLPAMCHRLLGFPYCLGESPFIVAFCTMHGLPHPSEMYRLPSVLSREQLQRREWDLQHKAEAEWRLLLQVYSNEEANMDLSGGGVLHFCIPRAALARRDFDRVWVTLQGL